MNKFWLVYSRSFFGQVSKEFKSANDAANYAKELKDKFNKDYFIMEAIAYTGQPLVQIDLTKEDYKDAMASQK